MTVTDYCLCGLRLRSTLPLPELARWAGTSEGDPDVTVEAAAVPDRLQDAVSQGEYLSVSPDAVLLNIPDAVRILTRRGREISVDIAQNAADEGWRLFLLGAAFGHLCHQRGLLPLHAASLQTGSRTLAIAGPSGAGKSTLALALVQQGAALLSDDVTVLQTEPEILVQPSYPRLKLWREALDAMGIPAGALQPVRAGLEKFDLRPHEGFDPRPRPLDALLILSEGEETGLRRLTTIEAAGAIRQNIFRPRAASLLGRDAAIFAKAAALAGVVPVFAFVRPKKFEALGAGVALLERTFAA